jgi:hypothetical protein
VDCPVVSCGEVGKIMRYFKGAIALSTNQDLPLLRQVMYSKFITQTQLWQLMRHDGRELSRGSFWWRIKRLTEHGFIARHLIPAAHSDPIFTIAASGIFHLVECWGMPYSGPETGPEIRPDISGVAHALALNGIHLDLLRGGCLISWESEMEIRCRNELSVSKYAKEYDAVVAVALGGRHIRFALEYERTSKARSEYEAISGMLDKETNLNRVLYLARTRHIHSLLAQHFTRMRQRVFLALADDLANTTLPELHVLDTLTKDTLRLVDIP